jgi:hypothetical protein
MCFGGYKQIVTKFEQELDCCDQSLIISAYPNKIGNGSYGKIWDSRFKFTIQLHRIGHPENYQAHKEVRECDWQSKVKKKKKKKKHEEKTLKWLRWITEDIPCEVVK